MAKIVEDARTSSEWIVTALRSSGYVADFAPNSLWEIERFFDEHTVNGAAKPGGSLSQDLGKRLFALGCYLGEVIRRHQGGEWVGNDDDPQAEINIGLQLNDGSKIWPVQRVMKRFKPGQEESLVAYGVGLGLMIGPNPKRNKVGRLAKLLGMLTQ